MGRSVCACYTFQHVMAFAAGTRLGSYEIVAPLGAGGMGVVYKALDVKLNRSVALKFLPPEDSTNEKDKERLLKEARAASALDHPNIGVIYGIEESVDGQLFIVMAYYDGETLQHKIRRGALTLAQTLEFAIQMAQGLAVAHAKGIVHRDVKPANVMVTTEGVVKVLDFGLASVASRASTTRSESISGTAQYMSPEQALGSKLDPRSDIFSFGLVLSEMATGCLPFAGDSIPTILFAIVNGAPSGVAQAPEDLQPIIYKALAKDPAKRYQSLTETIGDLKELQSAPASVTRSANIPVMRSLVADASGSGFIPAVGRNGAIRRRAGMISLAVPIVLGILFSIPATRSRLLHLGSPPAVHIAVLPFTAIGKDGTDEALSDGLMEALTGKLSNLESANGSLWVVPSAELRRRKVNDATAAHREFGVNMVITGTVQKSGKYVRLTLNLIDATDVRQLGSASVEDPAGDYLALQDQAVARLAKLLNVSVRSGNAGGKGAEGAPAAYESYLKGIGFLRRYDKPGNLDAAIAAFEEASANDPKSALALAGLGEAYWTKYILDKDPRWIDVAIDYCRTASALNDQLAPVFITLGRIHDLTGKPALALQEFQRALDTDSRNAEAYIAQAAALEHMGRLKDAESAFSRAAALRPDYWDGYNKLGLFYYRQRRFEDAVRQFRRAIELTPDNGSAYVNLGAAYDGLAKPDLAVEAYRKSIELNPTYAAYANLGAIYAAKLDWAAAVQARQKALQLNEKDYRVWVNLANSYRQLHEEAKARAAYDRALTLATQAVKLSPLSTEAQTGLATIYSSLGMREKALDAIRTSLALSPDDSSVLQRVAIASERLGDRDQALQLIGKYFEHGGSLERVRRDPDLQSLITDSRFRFPGK